MVSMTRRGPHLVTIVASMSWTGEVTTAKTSDYSALFSQLADLMAQMWADSHAWFYAFMIAVFVFVVLPAIWSREPERRQAAAEMFDRILRFRRRQ